MIQNAMKDRSSSLIVVGPRARPHAGERLTRESSQVDVGTDGVSQPALG